MSVLSTFLYVNFLTVVKFCWKTMAVASICLQTTETAMFADVCCIVSKFEKDSRRTMLEYRHHLTIYIITNVFLLEMQLLSKMMNFYLH